MPGVRKRDGGEVGARARILHGPRGAAVRRSEHDARVCVSIAAYRPAVPGVRKGDGGEARRRPRVLHRPRGATVHGRQNGAPAAHLPAVLGVRKGDCVETVALRQRVLPEPTAVPGGHESPRGRGRSQSEHGQETENAKHNGAFHDETPLGTRYGSPPAAIVTRRWAERVAAAGASPARAPRTARWHAQGHRGRR